ncbi:MAG: hypothetical protein JRN28_01295 [Nitrososphaerota archaeon]|nr:hypothetical protein [Nitrososphaerota archaeon]
MRPAFGVLLELAALALIFSLAPAVPGGVVFAVYVLLAEFAATFLIHCPAHYTVGMALGIRFTEMRAGRTTLARALPPRLGRFARLMPILTLRADRPSLARASRAKASAMFASGTVASTSAAFLVAGGSTMVQPLPYASLAWALALLYLAFDLRFSPRGGDLRRAKAALGR